MAHYLRGSIVFCLGIPYLCPAFSVSIGGIIGILSPNIPESCVILCVYRPITPIRISYIGYSITLITLIYVFIDAYTYTSYIIVTITITIVINSLCPRRPYGKS